MVGQIDRSLQDEGTIIFFHWRSGVVDCLISAIPNLRNIVQSYHPNIFFF
jgi:hypothetical protein